MSESLGVEEKTIKMIVRILIKAGLFTTGARGVNAPDMTALDAVRVVVAVVASPAPSRAVRDVKYFGALKPDMRLKEAALYKLKALDEDATLEEALLSVAEGRIPYRELMSGYLKLSQNGHAEIRLDDGYQEYHQRDQRAAAMAEYAKPKNEPRNYSVIEAWEATSRLFEAKVARSAEFPLEAINLIGNQVLGVETE